MFSVKLDCNLLNELQLGIDEVVSWAKIRYKVLTGMMCVHKS